MLAEVVNLLNAVIISMKGELIMISKSIKLLLSLFILTCSYAYGGDGPVLYLPFDNDFKDASDSEFAVELKGNESYMDGKFSKAFEFDGATCLSVADEKEKTLDGTAGLTIGVWTFMKEHHDNGIVVKLTSGNNWPCSYNLETWSDQLAYFDIGPDAGSYATASYPLNEWFYLVGVFDGAKGEDQIYINGKLEKTNGREDKVVPDGELPVYIGCVNINAYYFKGGLDDLVIYNRALSLDEIKQNMKGNILAVDKAGKLSTTWSAIKSQN